MYRVRGKAFFLMIALALTLQASAALAVDVGQPAPQLTVQEFDGKTFDLAAQHGKVVIVNFWATWCPPCRAEMPALKAVYDRYHSKGLELIGLSLDRSHDKDDAVKMAREYGFPAAMLTDATTNGFGTPGSLPLTIIVGPGGVVRSVHTPDQPELTEASLAATITPLFSQSAQAKAQPTA